MAIRNLLHMDYLMEFEEFLKREGYMILPLSKNPYEALRAKKGRATVIIYRRNEGKEHLSIADKDYSLVKKFLEERKAPAEVQDDIGEDLPWS